MAIAIETRIKQLSRVNQVGTGQAHKQTNSEESPKQAQTRPAQLPALTGLRFVAAVLVVMFHFLYIDVTPQPGAKHAITTAVYNIVHSGFTGVSFFFVLSGFILTYSYLGSDGRLRGSRRRFYWARFARIYPIYLFALLLDVIPFMGWGTNDPTTFQHGHFWPVLGLSPLLLQAWLPYPPTWDPPTWSLSAEALFYVLFPLLVPLVGRLRGRRLPIAGAAFWGVTALIVLLYVIVDPDRGQTGPWYDHHWLRILYDGPLPRLPEFFIGVAVARLFMAHTTGAAGEARRPRWLNPAWLSVVAAAGIIVVWLIGPLQVALVNQVVLDPLYALLIYSMAFGKGPLTALFSAPIIALLGEASYALYILQWPVHDWLGHGIFTASDLAMIPSAARGYVYFTIFLGVTIVCALLAYSFIERPARRALRRVGAPERASQQGAATPRRGERHPVRVAQEV